jgi:hypothetical protein
MKGMILAVGLIIGSAGWALAAEPGTAKPWAATVQPLIDDTPVAKTMPPRIDPLPGPNVPLSPKERHGVPYGKEWANNRDVPARGEDGSIVFVFGATLPTVVCAPLYVCDLALQAGESVNDLNVGDSVRWQIEGFGLPVSVSRIDRICSVMFPVASPPTIPQSNFRS